MKAYPVRDLIHGADDLHGGREPRNVRDELIGPDKTLKKLYIYRRAFCSGSFSRISKEGALRSDSTPRLPLDGLVDEASEPLRRPQDLEAVEACLGAIGEGGGGGAGGGGGG